MMIRLNEIQMMVLLVLRDQGSMAFKAECPPATEGYLVKHGLLRWNYERKHYPSDLALSLLPPIGPPVYFDGRHLVCPESLDHLHAFAKAAGANKSWYQATAYHPHYHIWSSRIHTMVIAAGAIQMDERKLIKMLGLRKVDPWK